MELSQVEFNLLRGYIHEICGMFLNNDKQYLIKQRLMPIANDLHCQTFSELYQKIKEPKAQGLKEKITNAITTNETSFFRDGTPFKVFQNFILEDLITLSSSTSPLPKKIKIWSAASSTGEEAYSLAMLIHEHLRVSKKKSLTPDHFKILATDISTEVLNQAKSGRFNSFKMKRGLTNEMRDRYFETDGKYWRVSPHIHKMVQFQQFNLLNSCQPLGYFNLIFCRNVLIYFEQHTRENVLKQLHKALLPNGLLVLGATENMCEMKNYFSREIIENTLVYRKK